MALSRAVLADYPHPAAGKVRDLYAVDGEHLLLVASDSFADRLGG
jgi:phosphoribosylaminoimidazole-succinocarboxamide synthase